MGSNGGNTNKNNSSVSVSTDKGGDRFFRWTCTKTTDGLIAKCPLLGIVIEGPTMAEVHETIIGATVNLFECLVAEEEIDDFVIEKTEITYLAGGKGNGRSLDSSKRKKEK